EAAAEELKAHAERVSRNYSRDSQVQLGLVIIALKAAIREDNSARSMQLFGDLLRRYKDQGGATYLQLLQEIRNDITELKERNTEEQLDKMKKSFAAFLDAIAKKRSTPEMMLFLANANSVLDKPAAAKKLLEELAKDPNLTPEMRKAVEKALENINEK